MRRREQRGTFSMPAAETGVRYSLRRLDARGCMGSVHEQVAGFPNCLPQRKLNFCRSNSCKELQRSIYLRQLMHQLSARHGKRTKIFCATNCCTYVVCKWS
jgi:hypothetical protein